ncbi:phosphotransferase [Microbacterium sp. Marseille-Q6965]|uniref:phosphotransferase n=1 Tax=Microbacterium sp. Marseille-Q6965 TaxID=2965072 RepID=UPI0021B7F955|nr:phosphotransferase [Microbacterium sp. Marseille-Q6965]
MAAQLVWDQFNADVGEVRPLPTAATTSYVFRVGAGLLARFPMHSGDAAAYRRELALEGAAMREFAEGSSFPAPRMLFIGRPTDAYPMPWSVQTWIPGEVVTPDSAASSSLIARDLAVLVGELRSVSVRGRSFAGTGRGGELRRHDAWVAHCLVQSDSLLPTERLRDLWERLRATPRAEPDVMSHKDLIPFNLLAGDGLRGVLDTGGFGPADPALDLVVGWHVLDAERRDEFRERVGPSETEWQRSIAWALQQALGLVWYYATTNPAMSALGRSTIERILAAEETGA